MSTVIPEVLVQGVEANNSSSDLVVINHNPYPGEVAVNKDSLINFDIISLPRVGEALLTEDGTPLLTEDGLPIITSVVNTEDYLDSVSIYVNDTLVYIDESFVGGWSGTVESLVFGADPDTIRFSLTPPSDYESSQTINVRVVLYNTTIGIDPVSSDWSFSVEDYQIPLVIEAVGATISEVWVTFDSPVRSFGDNSTGDSLTLSNYTISALDCPAVTPTISSIKSVTDSTIQLTTSIPLSFNKRYEVVVRNVTDLSGNSVVSTSVGFMSFDPAQPNGREFNLYKFVPRINRDEDVTQDLFKFLSCIQDVSDLLLYKIDRWTDIFNFEKADDKYLNLILQDLANPFPFVSGFSSNQKRKLISVLVDIYKSKGTKKGIKNVIRSFLGIEAEIVSSLEFGWRLGEDELGVTTVLGPGTPFQLYSFEVNVPIVITVEQENLIRSLVEYMKPAHTHFVSLNMPLAGDNIDHWQLGFSELGSTTILHE